MFNDKPAKWKIFLIAFVVISTYAGSATINFNDSNPVNFFSDINLNNNGFKQVQSLNGRPISDFLSGSGAKYGDGSDGDVIRTSDTQEDRLILSKRYVIEDGVNIDVDRVLVVYAKNKIVVNGTLNASGKGAKGGKEQFSEGCHTGYNCGWYGGHDKNGHDGHIADAGRAGDGGQVIGGDDPREGEDGESTANPGLASFTKTQVKLLRIFQSTSYDPIFDFSMRAGSGGAAGDPGTVNGRVRSQGGLGGNGGGVVVLVAPSVEVNGKIIAKGMEGSDGESGEVGAGGGGGGGGGLVVINSPVIEGQSNINVSRGEGGSGGSGTTTYSDPDEPTPNGGDGENGKDGELVILS